MIRELPFTAKDYNKVAFIFRRLGQTHLAILIFLSKRGGTAYKTIRSEWEGDVSLLKKALASLRDRGLVEVYNSKYRLTQKGEIVARAVREIIEIHILNEED